MTLSPIGDIGVSSLTENIPTTTITWETASDWDNAVSETFSKHASGVVEMAAGLDTFEDLSDGADLPSPYDDGPDINPTVDNSRVFEGSLSVYTGSSAPSNTYTMRLDNIGEVPDYVELLNNTDAGASNGWAYDIYNENDDIIMRLGNDSNEPGFNDGNGNTIIGNIRDGEWRRWTVTFDWANDQFDIERVELENGDNTQTRTSRPFINSSTEIKRVQITGETDYNLGGGDANGIQGNWYDTYYGVLYTSDLTTATKTLPSAAKPDLQNLSYTLNSQDVTLDIIGSPGTASKEIVSQTLAGP